MRNVLITGARAPVALHLTRLLAGAGMRVMLADHLLWPLAAASRMHAGYHRIASFVHDPDGAAQALTELLDREKIDVVIPTCEEVLHLAHYWQDAGPGARLLAPDLARLQQVHSKHDFITLCARLGLVVPETRLLKSPEDVAATKAQAAHLVYKPVWSRFGGSVLIKPGPNGLAGIHPTPAAPWVAQGYIDGDEISVYAIADEGRLTALAAYRAVIRAGAGAAVAFEPVDTGAVRPVVEAIVRRASWTGQISFDLIVRSDGQALPIECNPRATSGLHFFHDHAAFAAALFGGPEAAPDVTAAQGVPLALWAYGGRAAFGRARSNIQSVFAWPGDRVGLWPQLKSLAEFAAIAARHRITLTEATTRDIAFGGGP
ncbi:MAG: ATP-grasp domain-containing protein [Pseudomonadota bacterium]